MAINNCLFSPTSENPHGFQIGVYLQKFSAKPRNCSYTTTLKNNY
jgi:hypothetical protein